MMMNNRQSESFAAETAGRSSSTATLSKAPVATENAAITNTTISFDKSLGFNPVVGD